jgi:hypothetical protein
VTEATATPAAPARTRAPRRSPTELTFRLDESTVEQRAADEPAWLADDRRDALARFRELPVEAQRLYTPYVDLRGADLSAVTAWQRLPRRPAAWSPGRAACRTTTSLPR